MSMSWKADAFGWVQETILLGCQEHAKGVRGCACMWNGYSASKVLNAISDWVADPINGASRIFDDKTCMRKWAECHKCEVSLTKNLQSCYWCKYQGTFHCWDERSMCQKGIDQSAWQLLSAICLGCLRNGHMNWVHMQYLFFILSKKFSLP